MTAANVGTRITVDFNPPPAGGPGGQAPAPLALVPQPSTMAPTPLVGMSPQGHQLG